jgi:hypothetical protein
VSTEHRPKVRKVIDPDWPDYPWRMDCSGCGAASASTYWHLAIKAALEHVQAAVEHAEMEPIDMLPFVKTRLAWDLLEHDEINGWLPRLGLVPADPEMSDMEHREAHKRAAAVAPLSSLSDTYSAVIADIQSAYLSHESERPVDAEDQEIFTDMVFRILRTGVHAVLAEFLADGVLAYGPTVVAVLESA